MKHGVWAVLALVVCACSPATQESAKVFEPVAYSSNGPIRPIELQDLAYHMMESIGQWERGEFETTEIYEQRIANASIHPLQVGVPYVVVHTWDRFEYDPDAAIFTHTMGPRCINEHFPKQWQSSCRVERVYESDSTYKATNAFGKEVEVSRSEGVEFHFLLDAVNEAKLIGNPGWREIPNTCSVPVSIAQEVSKTLQIGYAVSLKEARLIRGEPSITEPTINVPFDATYETIGIPVELLATVCFNGETGQIVSVNNY